MKQNKLSLLINILLISTISYSQTTDWKVSGNSVTTDSKLGTNSNYDLVFETHNLERMRLTRDGKLGIGIGSPDVALHIVGDLKLEGQLTVPTWYDPNIVEPRIIMTDPNGNFEIALPGDLYQMMHAADCLDDGNGNSISIWSNGYGSGINTLFTGVGCPTSVGIGTNDPIYDLHVDGTSFSNRILVGEELTVLGNSASAGVYNMIQVTDYSQLDHPIMNLNNKGAFFLNYHGDGNPLTIRNAVLDDDLFRINPNGSLDIKYTGPTDGTLIMNVQSEIEDAGIFALTSDGKVWCQGLEVMHAPFWGDFVFEEVYQLRPLHELEQYIQTNKHLPDFPSAQTLEEEGLDVYEMLRLLTIKVEELTLYTIELEKQIEANKK